MNTVPAIQCNLCETRDLVLAPGANGPTTFMVCPKCDDHACTEQCKHGTLTPNFGPH